MYIHLSDLKNQYDRCTDRKKAGNTKKLEKDKKIT